MNREKKEALKKEQSIVEGMSPEQLEIYQEVSDICTRINTLRSKVHHKLFPEEYDFMSDDHIDIKARRRGINPMSEDYQMKVPERRQAIGIRPLSESGCCDHPDSSHHTHKVVQRLIESGDLRGSIMNLVATEDELPMLNENK